MNYGLNLKDSRIATYARFSSDNQRDASTADQQRVAVKFIGEHGGDGATAVHIEDKAVSASSLRRDGFEKLIALARTGKIDVIVVENIDRISRDFADSAIVFRELRYLNVRLLGVSNGFDSFSSHAQIQLALDGWKNEEYLKDLRFKTRRGQEGRVIKGMSAGGLPIGYRTEPVVDGDNEVIGHSIHIDEGRAAIVRRIFKEYLDGHSLDGIAKLLNDEGVEPARRGKYKNKGWIGGSVRMILHNEAYVGKWTWGKKKWGKLPGTNTRRYRPAPADQVICKEYPERRIIDAATWEATHAKLASVRNHYTRKLDGSPKGMAHPGKKTRYPLSNVLYCGECGSRMIIYGGSGPMYYRCSNNKKKGICKNAISLREDHTRTKIMNAIKAHVSTGEAIDELRKRIAHWLGELTQKTNDRLKELRAWLARTEGRIDNLTLAIADGDFSPTLRERLKALETERAEVRRLIAEVEEAASTPVRLPSPDQIVAGALNLERAFEADPNAARDALAQLFEDGRITLHPKAPRAYVARSRIFLGGLAGPTGGSPRLSRVGSASSTSGIAPAQLARNKGSGDFARAPCFVLWPRLWPRARSTFPDTPAGVLRQAYAALLHARSTRGPTDPSSGTSGASAGPTPMAGDRAMSSTIAIRRSSSSRSACSRSSRSSEASVRPHRAPSRSPSSATSGSRIVPHRGVARSTTRLGGRHIAARLDVDVDGGAVTGFVSSNGALAMAPMVDNDGYQRILVGTNGQLSVQASRTLGPAMDGRPGRRADWRPHDRDGDRDGRRWHRLWKELSGPPVGGCF